MESIELKWGNRTMVIPKEIYWKTLFTFPHPKALHMDYILTDGAYTPQYVRDFVPINDASWANAIRHRSMGMLVFLRQRRVLLPSKNERLLELCVHNGYEEGLKFLLEPHPDWNWPKNKPKWLTPPTLDDAFEKGFGNIVRIIKEHFPFQMHKLLNDPSAILNKIVAAGDMDLLCLMIPDLYIISTVDPLLPCFETKKWHIFVSLLRNLKITAKDALPKAHKLLVLRAAAVGNPGVLDQIESVLGVYPNRAEIYKEAFLHGHLKLLADSYQPDDESIRQACEWGKSGAFGHVRSDFPIECLRSAAKSGHAQTIRIVGQRVKIAGYTMDHMHLVIQAKWKWDHMDSSDPCITMYQLIGTGSLDVYSMKLMCQYNRLSTLQWFRFTAKLHVFMDETFLTAARHQHEEIIILMLKDPFFTPSEQTKQDVSRILYTGVGCSGDHEAQRLRLARLAPIFDHLNGYKRLKLEK